MEKHQLEKQLQLQDPPLLTNDWLQALEKESLSGSGSAVPITSLQQKQILKVFLTHVLVIVRYSLIIIASNVGFFHILFLFFFFFF